jgi:hypothetical protein
MPATTAPTPAPVAAVPAPTPAPIAAAPAPVSLPPVAAAPPATATAAPTPAADAAAPVPVAPPPVASSHAAAAPAAPAAVAAAPTAAAAAPTTAPVAPAPTAPEADAAVTTAPADPIVRKTTMAGAPHTLKADPATGKVEFNSVFGYAVEKIQAVVNLVPDDTRKNVTDALALAVDVTSLIANVALQPGAKESIREVVLKQVTIKMDDLASAIRLFGDTGQITDADPGVIKRAREAAEKKAAAAAESKKQAETQMEAAASNAAKPATPPPAVANAPANANAPAGGLAPPPPPPAPAPVVAKPEEPKQFPVANSPDCVMKGPDETKPGKNIPEDQATALLAQPGVKKVGNPKQHDNIVQPGAASTSTPDGPSAADAGKKDFEKRALAFEKKLGLHAYGHSRAVGVIDDMIGQCKTYMTAVAGKWEDNSNELKAILAESGDDKVNMVGAVGKEIEAVKRAFDPSAPMQVKWHHILHFFEHHLMVEVGKVTSSWDTKFVEALQAAKIDVNELRERRKQVAADTKPLPAWNKDLPPGTQTSWDLFESENMAGQPHTRVKEGRPDGTLGKTADELGVKMSADEAAFQNQGATPAPGADESDPQKMMPRWSSGSKGWMMNERDAWVRRQRQLGLPLAAGPSGHTTCMMNAGIYFKQDIFALRLAAIGNLLPFGHHSLVEVMTAAQSFGAPFTPGQEMYTNIKPLEPEDLRALAGGKFPHEEPSAETPAATPAATPENK